MLRPRFFTRQALESGATVRLEKEPSRHIAKALRMQAGATLCLFDGSGAEGRALITHIDRNHVEVRIEEVLLSDRESPLETTLAISISRGDRMDTVVQKATELGVSEIRPLISERTEVRLDPARLAKKREHWQRIAISACEQCGRNRLPVIRDTAGLSDVLAEAASDDALKLLLHTGGEETTLPDSCASLFLLVGPEGGFSDHEAEAAIEAGFQSLLLGPRVLRTETAPLAALAVAQARWGDVRF